MTATSSAPNTPAPMSRRQFLRTGALRAGAVAAATAFPQIVTRAATVNRAAPNILFILCDQWRFPQHLTPDEKALLDGRLPNYVWLRDHSVKFTGHYGAAAGCTPVRSTILTGLYTHQTALLNTFADNGQKDQADTLNPGFLTWGTALRELGYQTYWWGKWHESPATAAGLATAGLSANLEQYGFGGGTFPPYVGSDGKLSTIIGGPQNGQPDQLSPIGFLNQGIELDGFIANQFAQWLASYDPATGPFATAVSLINPNDIKNYPINTLQKELTDRDRFIGQKPPNDEDLATLQKRKPGLQQALYYTNQLDGSADQAWRDYLNYYYWLQTQVDLQIGNVLRTLQGRPDLAENTIIIFTADHGDHGGSHGLHEKALTVYEESIHLPLFVHDPTGRWSRFEEIPRSQLTSTVDLFPLLLTLAKGGRSWLNDSRFSYLAADVDWAGILVDPAGSGRDYIVSTSDEFFADESDPAETLAPADAPFHVIGIRTPAAKFATYNYWKVGSIDLNDAGGQELELYNYLRPAGRLELDNSASTEPWLVRELQEFIRHEVLPRELRRPLPDAYRAIHEAAVAAYVDGVQIPNSRDRA
jgi:arylsulfatase A-like enzyme